MKRLLLASIVMSISFGALSASTGTIIIHGGISDNTCEISPNDEFKLVYLPVIGKNTLVSNNTTAGATMYQIGLEKCPDSLNTAGLFFESGPSVFPDTGLLKAYKLGATVPSGNSSAFPSPLDNPTNTQAYFDKVLGAVSSSTISPNLAFELLDNAGEVIKIGDSNQRTQDGLFVKLTANGGFSSGVFYGTVRYKNYGSAAPESGYYFSHVGFTIQYP
ncbi:fimbrial protein [Yokenella regensburgei]|uniref:fimbrial protein n=1 Tax=Yokenella regensburgei TaxID=158877 RepID=UPI001375EF09|nr:hypothetical protein [Yokenella regensburgei]KAF1366710.1 type 1 fimbria pilin [Yokenella regensburgei]